MNEGGCACVAHTGRLPFVAEWRGGMCNEHGIGGDGEYCGDNDA